MRKRDSTDLDTEWKYYILVVKLIEETERGIMFDAGATDSDRCPREGICIATNWIPPATGEPSWGQAAGQRWGSQAAPYFRTVIHELGHAFGLDHNDAGYMNTSDTYAYATTPDTPFPTNLEWFWKAEDLERLRTWPDVYLRPGGVPYKSMNHSVLPISMNSKDSKVPSSKDVS